MSGVGEPSLLLLTLAAARRLDASHVFWSATMDALEGAATLEGIPRRSTLFRSLAMAEVTVISLSRGVEMLYRLRQNYSLGMEIPTEVDRFRSTLRQMRNALEHIDERATGRAKDGTSASAMSIFFQPCFVDQGVLTYAGKGISFTKEVPAVLVRCREAIKSAIELWPAREATRVTKADGCPSA